MVAEKLTGENTLLNPTSDRKQKFYDIVFIIGFLCCLIPGTVPALIMPASALLVLCIAVSFFNKNFYCYAALFMFVRYIMLVGDTPAYRLYSYMITLKFLVDIFKLKFRIEYIPAIFVIILHSLFALPPIASEYFDMPLSRGIRIGFNVIVDIILAYIIVVRIREDNNLLRKFFYVFMLGGIASGFYGWFNPDVSVNINISGAGVHTVNRNFGALSDSNFAGFYYSLCVMSAVVLKGIPLKLRIALGFVFLVLILQTASLSALLILGLLICFYIVLRFRFKSIFILTALFVVGVVSLSLLLTIPQFRKIEMIAGLIIRIEEKLSYIPRGRWDLLTTDRTALWGLAWNVFMNKPIWGKLIGGSVLTVVATDYSIFPTAVHNSYIQSLLNFGIGGTLMIYLPLFAVFVTRLFKHFSKESGYENEDLKIMQMLYVFIFIVFGSTVDFFVDWPLMIFYFI